ncbi:hypothetical protein DNTS_029691 [Danionella cerebrum]|uniref:Connector enhancer of kinase suppressor of Ras 1 n=1 Tax=Danionella cerebrum TaxID=2873325 RepID=A0A553RAY9_9TELE|nr:hypothetical protein DNTS_029691 [Danionella translucida]
MEPITSWSTERVTEWFRGVDAPLQQYPFSEWKLSGSDLLQLSSSRLEKLGVHKIGHQELILDAVEKLCALTYSVGGENLRSLTEKLQSVAHSLQMSIQGRWRVNNSDGQSATKLPQQLLQAVLDVIIASNGLVSLLNRYQFDQETGYGASGRVASLCKDLDTTVHKETTVFEKEKDIISICRQLVVVCDEILNVSPSSLLIHTAQLESIDLVPASPGDHVSPAEVCDKILEGDEVIQVNGQIVVRSGILHEEIGLLRYLRAAQDSAHHFRRDKSALSSDLTASNLKRLHSGAASLSGSRNSLEVSSPSERSPSPQQLNRASTSSCPDMAGLTDEKESKKSSTKGIRTALSRRRVSCRELGRPDCDGWLWKKRKETGMFMTQKWQRFWFVLKGPTLYWYNSQQEEKAEGLIKIGRYNIESAGEHKRKFVFKMCHPRFQNFFFAADNVNDMSKWINFLITAIQKHKKFVQSQPDSEEDCYSETESEEESSRSPLIDRKKIHTKTQTQSNTLPRTKAKQSSVSGNTTISQAGGSKIAGKIDEMDEMFNSLKKGGVSLTGQNQPMTHDQLRRSFIKRNKNPAKEAELQMINRLLEDSDFTPQKFREWKQFNEELLQDIDRQHKETNSSRMSEDISRQSLSDGEQLVDSETADDGDSTPTNTEVPMQTCTADIEEPSTENYFFI